ncbi:hypothetical protein FRZ06_08155 [Anoxybacterium hadale]|uniref:Uncharacterized protein n=1 Tax=Anoxybacterium hadale TaxID=3408580 RepID=A0ACD1A9W6_9FIRM|nr:hypothetical protein FRZ06_08155 [Clostridiales bacterium]
MERKQTRDIYDALIERLTDRKFLKTAGMTKKEMQQLLREGDWKNQIIQLAKADRVSCKAVLEACEKILCVLSPMPEQGWLNYIFTHTLNQMFPESSMPVSPGSFEPGRIFYLRVLRYLLEYEARNRPFDPLMHIAFLTTKEVDETETAGEYYRLLQIFGDQHVYEFMRIASEITPFQTLAHIAGVHHVSMYIGKQLLREGLPVDLALLSGAALGHDIGKFGCRPEESGRIPYLHYYYTDRYFKKNHMPAMGHIAANHSTWDLELENLSVESLILIYADFRVKSVRDSNHAEEVCFYSLAESFDVILNKLDHVDAMKKYRYEKVYAKLHDFEAFMVGMGIQTDLFAQEGEKTVVKDAVLLEPEEVLQRLKHLAIQHNIMVMHKLNSETAFGNLLEAARSEKNWKNMRAYINIIHEYFTYMTQKQKLKSMALLYELLMHREGDIRRQCADLMGNIIVNFDEEYRKELPEGVRQEPDNLTSLELWEKYLDLVVNPDHKVTEQHRRWLWFTLKLIITSVLERCKGDCRSYLDAVLRLYRGRENDPAAFVLLDSALALPLEFCTAEDKRMLLNYAVRMAECDEIEVQISAFRVIRSLSAVMDCLEEEGAASIKNVLKIAVNESGESIEFLKYKISENIGLCGGMLTDEKAGSPKIDGLKNGAGTASRIFLENLKAATPWVIKHVNIELLLDQIQDAGEGLLLQIAAHFSNLIKVSERVAVRHSAGSALLTVIPHLNLTQRNEIAVELSKGLEIGAYEFSKYIPEYLGQLALYLHPFELDELILDFKKLLWSNSDRVCSVTLDTVGVMLQNYPAYRDRFQESEECFRKRRETMIGLLLKGLSDYRDAVSQEAFLVIGQQVFGAQSLTIDDKFDLFSVLYKKLLTLLMEREETELTFFGNASALNHIYRFLSDYQFHKGCWDLATEERIAFLPGSFDPFSKGHKGIVEEIKKRGFSVYLAVDEFSWSKKTQPKLIRRQIVSMSVAEETNVYLFPDHIPVNIGNPHDLIRLRALFPQKEIYLVVGSDVIENASSYLAEPSPDSVHSFHHIVFPRPGSDGSMERKPLEDGSADRYSMISGSVIELGLPVELDEISSSRIRENIDRNRDISNQIDPLAQSYIYENSLYLREPKFKQVFSARRIEPEIRSKDDRLPVEELLSTAFSDRKDKVKIRSYLQRKDTSCVILRDGEREGLPIAAAVFHEIGMADLYSEFGDLNLATVIRRITSGKIIVLAGIAACSDAPVKNPEQLVLTEALAYCLKNDFTYAIYHDHLGGTESDISDLLKRQGFQEIGGQMGEPVFAVDMKFPVALFRDIETILKEPFHHRRRVLEAAENAHRKLQGAVTRLFPGNLVLSFDAGMTNHRIVDRITAVNREQGELFTTPAGRKLGKSMCVPFGKVLHGLAVPNTVTKSLHTEKVFEPGIRGFKIKEFPNYSPLSTQVRTIRSFQRPVILVDDLLHKGYRIKELDPIFKEEGVEVEKIIVGLLSGRGKDLMTLQGRSVESVYFMPSLGAWFDESSLYPFIGGDGFGRECRSNAGLIPSVNLILPYAAPGFLMNASKEALFYFSMTCLENAAQLLTVLEEEYQQVFERNLTLNRLSEAVAFPRYPDKGEHMNYDMNLAPSAYIASDMEHLKRLENLIVNR